MLKIFIACFAILFLTSTGSTQQVRAWGDPHVRAFVTNASKDPAYANFRKKMNALVSSAKGTSTNAAAVKALLAVNQPMLEKLYTEAGMSKRMLTSKSSSQSNFMNTNETPGLINQQAIAVGLQKTITNYDAFYLNATDWDGMPPDRHPDMPDITSGTSPRIGTIVTTSTPCDNMAQQNGNNFYCHWGSCMYVFKQKFTVPNDPQILSARVRFEYSFEVDGWDTEGAINEIELYTEAGSTFNSTTYNDLPTGFAISNDHYKKIATLYGRDTVTSDFKEIHINKNSSFTMEGYVVPGAELNFAFGFGYPADTYKGWNGTYRYGVFKLKKITITYLK